VTLLLINRFRGGSADPSSSSNTPPPPPPQTPINPEFQQAQQMAPEDYLDQQIPPVNDQNDVPFAQQTFQERIDTWKNYQMEHAAEQQASLHPRDEKGQMKLLMSVSKGSRALTFFILMWRNVHLYETVDQNFKGALRFMGVLPLTILFIANMAGVVASITSPGHSAKKRLKAILNLDKLLEVYLILFSIMKLIFSSSSNLIPREVYIARILHSTFFIIQCQTVTRFVWYVGVCLCS
jgi:hypothetical protein